MEKRQRMTLLGIAAVIAIAAVVIALVAGGGDDEKSDTTTQTQATQTQATEQDTPKPKPKPQFTQIRVEGGEPVGGVKEINAKKGDTVRLAVRADAPDHVHLHGYDVMRDVAPSKPARLTFKANIEGVFEVELEDSKVQIAEVTIEP